MREFPYESATSPGKVYTARIMDNGLLECNCKGWTTKREGKPRHCTHTKDIAAQFGLKLEERDGHMWVEDEATTAVYPSTLQAVAPAPSAVMHTDSLFLPPMLASAMPEGKTADSFAEGWIMEEKFDGHRIIMAVNGGTIKAWSRTEHTRTLPRHIAAIALGLPEGIYDGELIIPGGHSYDVTAGINTGQEVLVLFDLLHSMGEPVVGEPQGARRQLLELAHQHVGYGAIELSDQFEPSSAIVQAIWDKGGEGAIIKRLSARYRPGIRTGDWVKVKAVGSVTVTITGYKVGENGPYSSVNVVDANGIETTVKTLNNQTLREIAKEPQRYIGARLVISYHERTPSGKYRHPMFDHFAGPDE